MQVKDTFPTPFFKLDVVKFQNRGLAQGSTLITTASHALDLHENLAPHKDVGRTRIVAAIMRPCHMRPDVRGIIQIQKMHRRKALGNQVALCLEDTPRPARAHILDS